jgi:ribosomal-protein-alanine N-acetyltransferase
LSEPLAIPELTTPRWRLRAWVELDAGALHAAFGDPETMRFWDSPPQRDVAETVAFIRDSRSADPRFHAAFAITSRATGETVGMVNYHERRPERRRLAVGWILVRPWRRQGIMREAVPALLNHCFGILGAHRIEARIEAENAPSLRLAEYLGFQHEGDMRDWTFVDGEPRSVQMHALLRPDWVARRDHVSSTSNP